MKYSLFILLLITLFASCKKEQTVWESDWSAPVINDTLTLANLVNDSTLAENSGFYELGLTRTLFDLEINEVVKIPDTTINEQFTNGSIDNWAINPGTTIFPPGVITSDEHVLELEDIQLKKITLKGGVIKLRIENPLALNASLILDLPGFTKNGVPFNQSHPIVMGSVSSPGISEQIIDLTGYTIDLTGQSGTDYNTFVSDVDVIADPNGVQTNFGNEHTVVVKATFSDIIVSYAQGYFGSRLISDIVDVDLSALDIYESGAIDLSTLSLSFGIENGIKVGAEGVLNSISNENALGTVVSLTGGGIGNAFNIDPATGTWNTLTPSINTLNFTSGNSNIEAYLENLGTKHTVDYSIQLNPWGNTSGSWDEIYPSSALKVKLYAQMPLVIGLNNLILKDTFEVDLVQSPEKTRILSGELILNTSNAFPFSADVSIMLLDANGNLLHTVNGSEKIEAAQFGSFDTNHNLNVAESEVHFILSKNVVSELNDVKFVLVKSHFNSMDPMTMVNEQMIIPVGAFLSVKLKTKFKSENRF
ncbi:MAG: hypothetical protein ACJA1C_003131 [Crocinitomicaceae bacterium]|jgi:hypothetical protein